MPAESIFDKIRAIDHLTPSETKIARYLDQAYPLLALETVTSISEGAGVGRATVVRFVSRIGFSRFSEFQKSVRQELLSRLDSPAEKYLERKSLRKGGKVDAFRLHSERVIKNLHEATRRIDSRQFEACAKMLASCRGTIYIMGYRTSFSLAHFFSLQLSFLRQGVMLLDNLGGALPNQVSTVSKRDICFLIFNMRYSRRTEQTAHWFKKRGCRLILLTDRETNPLSSTADIQFVAPSEGLSLFDSRCTGLAVLETLIDLVALRYDSNIDQLLDRVETAFEAYGTFSTWGRRPSKKTARYTQRKMPKKGSR